MQSIITFIKYHNLVPIILGVVLIATGGAFANEDVRNAVIGEEIITEQGIDNSQILAADLDNFDIVLQITGVNEDGGNYYVDYTYQTLAIKNNVWQLITKGKTLTVSKKALGNEDLGLYAQEELGEVADYELNYLKEVQVVERKKGMTKLVASVDYTGFIGLVLDIKDKILPGYEPVIEEPEGSQIVGEFNPKVSEESSVQEPIVEEFTPTDTSDSSPSASTEVSASEQGGVVAENPETTIDSHPAPETTAQEAYFTFGSTDSYATYQCKLNLEDWTICTSPQVYYELTPGDYTFQVYSIDAYQNQDSTPATFSWTILEGVSEPEAAITGRAATTTDQVTTSTEPVATSTEPVATSTEPTSTTTEPVCQPAEEICDGIDNDCDGQIDEEVNCGTTSCDTTLNLIGECQNPCLGADGCGNCESQCVCIEGFSDCDSDVSNGCEIASSTCPAAEPSAE